MADALIAGDIDYVTEDREWGCAMFKLTGCLLGITLY